MTLPSCKHARLKDYDYSQPGAYFITICTRDKKCTLGGVVRGIKTTVSRTVGYSVWQDNYYEHVVRNEEDLLRILDYMASNSARWAEDKYYIAQES